MSTSNLVNLASIPTLSQLYRAGTLVTSNKKGLPEPRADLNGKICTIRGDITKLQVDAIVNAANSGLRGGGGVDGAIQRAAGPKLLEECRTLGGCAIGSAKITEAYNLPCQRVIHAVGPMYDNDQKSEPLLRGAYRTSLQLAVENDCKSIAFPAISTGVYSYPRKSAAMAALTEVKKFLDQADGQKLDKVIFVNFEMRDVDIYNEYLP